MSNPWPTKANDLRVCEKIIDLYVQNSGCLSVFEEINSEHSENNELSLSPWVNALATYFRQAYGTDQGDFVTKQLISLCLINGEVVH